VVGMAFLVATARANCPNDCSNNGICNHLDNSCACFDGFGGPACDVSTLGCKTSCSGHGTCMDGECDCVVGFSGANCGTVSPSCTHVFNCTGHGRCVGGKCVCAERWSGDSCDRYIGFHCPTHLRNCTDHGMCAKTGDEDWACICDVGFCGDQCNVVCEVTDGCPGNCTGKGSCIGGNCRCDEGFSGDDCATVEETCPNFCSGRGTCIKDVCECDELWLGDDCGIASDIQASVTHGSCSKGKCTCDEGWTGLLCESPVLCQKNCSGQGSCVKGKCHCTAAFTGEGCTLACPTGDTKFGCGGRGTCGLGPENKTAMCFCKDGATGDACQYTDMSDDVFAAGKGSPLGIALLAFVAFLIVLGIGGTAYNKSKGATGIDAMPGVSFLKAQVRGPDGPNPEDVGYTKG